MVARNEYPERLIEWKDEQVIKVVDSLYIKPDVDIYITGSNAYMLSGDRFTVGNYNGIQVKYLSDWLLGKE